MQRHPPALGPSLLVLASLAGCGAFDPRVGASQESCGVDLDDAGAAPGNAGYGATASSPNGGSMGSSQSCAPVDGGSSCDTCENTYCCMTRLACYADPVCVCADETLDSCIESLEDGTSAPSAPQIATCRNAFSARGTVEAARMTCLQTWCATACAVP
jgi:hypothetical protein